jgi:hypothetical protein
MRRQLRVRARNGKSDQWAGVLGVGEAHVVVAGTFNFVTPLNGFV